MIFLKNYTSEVPVHITIGRIEALLIRCGVSGIMKEYKGTSGKMVALTFKIDLDGQKPCTIRLPADEEAALTALWAQYANGAKLSPDGQAVWGAPNKRKKREDFRQQAERTAWKLMQDWVEVQLSLIQMKQADFMQVFLPYVWDGERTFYQALRSSGFKGLLADKSSS